MPIFVFGFQCSLNLGFVVFRGLRQRRLYYEAELRLNRRLARGVYLAVATRWEKGGRWPTEPGDRIGAYAVVMRRLERANLPDERLRAGRVTWMRWPDGKGRWRSCWNAGLRTR